MIFDGLGWGFGQLDSALFAGVGLGKLFGL